MKANRILLAGVPIQLMVKNSDLDDFEKLTKKELLEMGFEIKKDNKNEY